MVGADGFAVDASLIAADANKQRSVPSKDWKPEEIKESAVRAGGRWRFLRKQARQPDGGKRSADNIRAGGTLRLILIHHNRAPCAERTGFPFGVEHCVVVRRGAHDARVTQPPLRLRPIRGSSGEGLGSTGPPG